MRIHLIGIDFQNSFCKVVPPADQQKLHDGELCVPGAWQDSINVSDMILRLGRKITQMHFTMDSHHQWHIAHPCWIKDGRNQNPNPFTKMEEKGGVIIGSSFNPSTGNWTEIGEYTPTLFGEDSKWTYHYLKALQADGRYPHVIWPYHCLIGSSGYSIVPHLLEAIFEWERLSRQTANKITKGSCRYTEHFSAIRAEVPYPKDNSTQLNSDFIKIVAQDADEILLSGEALSHCWANTIKDLLKELGDTFAKKCVILTDAASSVTGFEALGEQVVKDMVAAGMRTTTTKDYLK